MTLLEEILHGKIRPMVGFIWPDGTATIGRPTWEALQLAYVVVNLESGMMVTNRHDECRNIGAGADRFWELVATMGLMS